MPQFTVDQFRAFENQQATIHVSDGEPIAATIVEVVELYPGVDGRPAQFSVLWRTEQVLPADQATCEVKLPDGEQSDLFLVAMGPTSDGEGWLYESIFA